MITYNGLFERLVSIDNLENAYWKAREGKSGYSTVKEFEKHWRLALVQLRKELIVRTYAPKPLKRFVLRDPKTRIICVSDFQDRIVHHALVNVLEPVFEPRFICDSFASRKGKGVLPAIKRFKVFLRKASHNGELVDGAKNDNAVRCFVLKADVKKYFDNVDHSILLRIIGRRVKDEGIIWLVRTILDNYESGVVGKGMPLGNWTSQFFANVYLNELDQFVKHVLKAKYYLRYVDDFVILHEHKRVLEDYRTAIESFLAGLKLELHPDKCSILPLCRGVSWVGFRHFFHFSLPREKNVRKVWKALLESFVLLNDRLAGADVVVGRLNGWCAYAMHGNSYGLRKRLFGRMLALLEACSYAKFTAKKDSDIDVYAATKSRKIKEVLEAVNSRLSVQTGKLGKDALSREIIENHVIIQGVEEFYESIHTEMHAYFNFQNQRFIS